GPGHRRGAANRCFPADPRSTRRRLGNDPHRPGLYLDPSPGPPAVPGSRLRPPRHRLPAAMSAENGCVVTLADGPFPYARNRQFDYEHEHEHEKGKKTTRVRSTLSIPGRRTARRTIRLVPSR